MTEHGQGAPARQQEPELWEGAYSELKKIARYRLQQLKPGQTLSATVLVHEVFLKFENAEQLRISDPEHFMALSSRAMRQVIIQYFREKGAAKRISDVLTFEDQLGEFQEGQADLFALDAALRELEKVDERMVRVVEARFFGGFSAEEISENLNISSRTVERDWQKARLLLYKKLHG